MKLATLRLGGHTRAARIEGDTAVLLDAPDLGALLAGPDAPRHADGPRRPLEEVEYAPLVPRPGKIFCVGLNYRQHILEMGRELPEHPTLFAKFADALIGAGDPIELPGESAAIDWEGELALVIGAPVRRADTEEAEAAIAGFAVLNDITARDWQYRSPQWLQGKTFEATTPFGPVLVTPDELPGGRRPSLRLRCSVDGQVVQEADTADLVFDPVTLVEYISRITTLRPGDVIATGTPGGVGHARRPPRYLTEGATVVTAIEGLGEQRNLARTVEMAGS